MASSNLFANAFGARAPDVDLLQTIIYNAPMILYWDRNGFCLWHKRLEHDRFRWPEAERQVHEISSRELRWLLEGLDIEQAQAHGNFEYQTVY